MISFKRSLLQDTDGRRVLLTYRPAMSSEGEVAGCFREEASEGMVGRSVGVVVGR